MTAALWGLGVVMGLALLALWATGGRLDCGCPAAGNASYGCQVCGYTRCAAHRYDTHDCNEKLGSVE